MNLVKKFILTQLSKGLIPQDEAVALLKELQDSGKSGDIAIIGMSCRLPMSGSKDEFWENIVNGRSCFVSKPEDKLTFDEVLKNPHYAEFLELSTYPDPDNLESIIGGFIPDNDKFDADFFNISPREARYIDPAQRVFMELSWAAIEDAGYSVNTIRDTMTGVFVGKDYSNSIFYKQTTAPDPMKVTGTWEGLLASRVSYAFNLRGPTMVIDTACSSGLVAVHEACNALRNNECQMALAGGLSIGAGGTLVDDDSEKNNAKHENAGTIGAVTSNDNQVRTFDKKCSGSVFGEGVVVFMLKPYDAAVRDNDNVYAVIKGSAINNDGASNGITAPNPLAQEAVITEAWKRAGVNAESINYVEAHGTGTLLGDPIEILGLTNAFSKQTNRKQFCGIGSVKTNLGHLVAASGCVSLMKVSLALQNEMLPPSINFEEPNQNIDFLNSPVYVVDKATPWRKGKDRRRAGINAFGFSGTNCHMVLEEAPPRIKESSPGRANHIITFSGRTETSLHSLIEEYCRFLETDKALNFGDMCYTANIGRGHYAHRLAIVASDVNDLREKLLRIVENDFSTQEVSLAYIGKHRIVSEKYQNRTDGELTEKELRELSARAQELSASLAGKDEYDIKTLEQLASLYAKGAGIDWNTIYEGQTHFKVSLPTYRFDRNVCWADLKVTELTNETAQTNEKQIHPVIDRMSSDSMNETIFAAKFKLDKHWFVQEHKIMGSNIVPGTAYIEIIKAVCQEYFHTDKIMIKSMTFIQPLVVGQEDKEAHIILKKLPNGVQFTVASKADDGETWTIHSEGNACIHDDAPVDEFRVADYADGGEEIVIDIPENETDELVYMGPRWHCIEHIYRNGDVLQSEIRLNDKFADDLKDYNYHPSMADAALNIPLQVYINHEMYLPLSYRNLKIHGKLPQRFFSRLEKLSGGNGSETMSFRVTLADEMGNILAEIEEYTTKKVGKFNSYVANTYYGLTMKKTELKGEQRKEFSGNALIFKDKSGIAEEFAKQLANTDNYFVEIADGNEKLDERTYRVDGSERSYDWLIEQIGVTVLDHVFHFASVDHACAKVDYSGYGEALNRGLYSMFFFPKAMLRHISGKTNFYLVTENAYTVTGEEKVKSLNRSFAALTKTLVQEYTNCTFHCFDITEKQSTQEIYEAICNADDQLIVALRDGKAYCEVLELKNVSDLATSDYEISKDGVYLITGGTGGLGLEIAKYLAEVGAGSICLTARGPMPAREKWQEICDKNRNKKMIARIRAIEQMEAFGAKVVVKSADVCDHDAMKNVAAELANEFGAIRGVVHCAGVAGDGFLYNKTIEIFNDVVNPKIMGMATITDILKENKPDFVVMFSSMQSAFGGSGQGDYTAANAFLDAYAEELRNDGICAKTINWPGWSETGMAVDFGVSNEMTLFTSLSTQKALIAFDFIMRHELSNVIPGELSMQFLMMARQMLPFKLSTAINREVARFEAKNSASMEKSGSRRSFNPDELVILGKDANEYTQTEKEVALIYAAVLDLTEIDIFENFNAMGGDSIIAAEVLKLLNEKYNDILNISDMFTYSCVMDMAEHIESKRALSADPEVIDAPK
ncbi:MAG: SDR family NAD(P)-dependent oxidoreductase [Ruminococcaceae bacterium]|nr:SDR family NAD(P)-dependent oxidoreductase [Oscillospiraceae bacterium]